MSIVVMVGMSAGTVKAMRCLKPQLNVFQTIEHGKCNGNGTYNLPDVINC
jgi:hypothetical protein